MRAAAASISERDQRNVEQVSGSAVNRHAFLLGNRSTARRSDSRCVQHVAHFARELFGVERLRQETHVRIAPIAGMKRFLKVTGNENDFCLRAGLAKPIGEMPAADFGHHHVGEKEIDLRRRRSRDQAFRVFAVGRFEDLVAEMRKTRTERWRTPTSSSSTRIVSVPVSILPVGRVFDKPGGGGAADAGQVNAEGRALAELALGADVAAALPNDAIAGGEAEPARCVALPWW